MNRLLIIVLLMLIGCKSVQKDINKSLEEESEITQFNSTNETIVSNATRFEQFNQQLEANNSDRSSMFRIEFDSITSFFISSNGDISATGYAPKISGSNSFSDRGSSISTSSSSSANTKDSTGRREVDSISYQEEKKILTTKEIKRTPSIIPYIGVGIVLILILVFILKKKPLKLF